MAIDFDAVITNPRLRQLFAEQEERRKAYPPESNLLPHETFWRDHQVWLQKKGYILRPRYHPDWVPSSLSGGKKGPIGPEDACVAIVSLMLFQRLGNLLTFSAEGPPPGCAENLHRGERNDQENTEVPPPIRSWHPQVSYYWRSCLSSA